jgi:hypothetical protein
MPGRITIWSCAGSLCIFYGEAVMPMFFLLSLNHVDLVVFLVSRAKYRVALFAAARSLFCFL